MLTDPLTTAMGQRPQSQPCAAAGCEQPVVGWCDHCQREYCRRHLLRDGEGAVLCICVGCWESLERRAEDLLPPAR